MQFLSIQHPTAAVQVAPSVRSFNPSIIEQDGARLMAYRCQPTKKEICVIHIAELGEDFQPVDDMRLDLPLINKGANLEDPRLFAGPDGALCIAWTEATYTPGTNWKCVQRYGIIKDGKLVKAFTPSYGRNNYEAKEKNWQFFTHQNSVHAIYSHSPHTVIELDGARVVNEYKTAGIVWDYGQPSGGTPPIPFNGELLTFFHAYEADVKHTRKYNFAAATMQAAPPFAITRHSVKPLMYGSEQEALAPDKSWHPLCVFPGGVIDQGETLAVSIGVNDNACAVAHINKDSLALTNPCTEAQATRRRIQITRGVMVEGIGRMPGEIITVKKSIARLLMGYGQAVLAS